MIGSGEYQIRSEGLFLTLIQKQQESFNLLAKHTAAAHPPNPKSGAHEGHNE
jgi:hypothetical protein